MRFFTVLKKLQKQVFTTDPHPNSWLIFKIWPVCFIFIILLLKIMELELVSLPFSCGRSNCYSDRLHESSFTNPRCHNFCNATVQLWNSLPTECCPFTYDLSKLKSGVNWYLPYLVLFNHPFCMSYLYFFSFSFNFMPCSG